MDKLKQWVVLTVLGVLALVAGSWFLLVAPKHQDADATMQQVASQRSANQALEVELEVLQAKAAALPAKRAALEKVTAKIPTGSDLPTLIRALTKAAADSGVELVSLTPSAPAAPAAQAPVAPVAPVPPAAGDRAANAATAATAPAAPATAPVAPVAPAAPAAAGVAGALAEIPMAIEVAGRYFDVEQFLAHLEELPRAVRIKDLNIAPGTGTAVPGSALSESSSPTLKASITGSVFMATGAAAPVAAPTIPAPTS